MVENSNYRVELESWKKTKNGWGETRMSKVIIDCKNYDTFVFIRNTVEELLEKEERNANQNDEQKD